MRFYFPVGPCGIVFRIGMVTTGVMGSLTYWRASRRRSATTTERSSHAPVPRSGSRSTAFHSGSTRQRPAHVSPVPVIVS